MTLAANEAKAPNKVVVVHESGEGNVIYGFEAPADYDVPEGCFDGELLGEIEESELEAEQEKVRKIDAIIRLLSIPVNFSDGDWINIHNEGPDTFFKPLTMEQLA